MFGIVSPADLKIVIQGVGAKSMYIARKKFGDQLVYAIYCLSWQSWQSCYTHHDESPSSHWGILLETI